MFYKLLGHLIAPEMKYVEKCKKEVIQRLKNKIKNKEKLNVAFLCSDEQKWKCQSLFDLMKQDDNFHPFIFIILIFILKVNSKISHRSLLYILLRIKVDKSR